MRERRTEALSGAGVEAGDEEEDAAEEPAEVENTHTHGRDLTRLFTEIVWLRFAERLVSFESNDVKTVCLHVI